MRQDEYRKQLPRIRELFARAFGREIPEKLLTWTYLEHPSGETRVTIIEQDGKIVSHYASLPAELRWKDRSFKAGISCTAMTDPAYGGRGLFQEAGKKHYEGLASAGYDCGFTFPNPDRITESIFIRKMGWSALYEIPTLTLDLTKKDLLTSDLGESDPNFEKFDYEALSDRDGLIHVPRTTPYLRWRYSRHPKNKYSVVALPGKGRAPLAYGVFKAYGGGAAMAIDLVDYYAPDASSIERLLSAVARRAKDDGASAINVWAPRHHFSHHLLVAFGFRHALPITYATYRPFRDGLPPDFGWYNNWWLMMGDSDVY